MIRAFEATYHFPITDVRAMSWRDVRFWYGGHLEIIADILGRRSAR